MLNFQRSETADYTVCCLTHVNDDITLRFAHVNRRLGAAKIVIYLDRAPTEREVRVANFSGNVQFIEASNAVYAAGQDVAITSKQAACFSAAYQRCETTWIGFFDIDEFIVPPAPMDAFLDQVPKDEFFLSARSVEGIWRGAQVVDIPFSATHARCRMNDQTWKKLRGSLYPGRTRLFRNNMLSHQSGKYIVRSGLQISPRVHNIEMGNSRYAESRNWELTLMHYDGLCHAQWRSRNLRRRDGTIKQNTRNRFRQKQQAFQFSSMLRSEEAFALLYHLDDRQFHILQTEGAVVPIIGAHELLTEPISLA